MTFKTLDIKSNVCVWNMNYPDAIIQRHDAIIVVPQAKKFVESVPQVVQKDISKDDAAKLKTILEAAGGVVVIE